jgi:FkbM family methyltransferase
MILSTKRLLGIQYSVLKISPTVKIRVRNIDILLKGLLLDDFETVVQKTIMDRVRPGMVVLDIGANIGFYTVKIADAVGDKGCVIAFEPNPNMIKELNYNINLNGFHNVIVEEIALSDTPGLLNFYFPVEGTEAHGSLHTNPTFEHQKVAKVKADTLDQVISRLNLGDIDLIKVDVEGAEKQVFEGATQLLSGKHKPAIIFECAEGLCSAFGHNVYDVLRKLSDFGYRLIELDWGDWLAIPNEQTINH